MSSVRGLISIYAENAKKHGEATLRGDSKVANICYDRMIESIKQIYELDPEGRLFLELLDNGSESVKLWCATHGLFINKNTSMMTLQELANGAGIFSFSASIVLEEWMKGSLESPF